MNSQRGSSLICEVCQARQTSCSGNLQTCKDSEDVCTTIVGEYKIAGRTFPRTFKDCATTSLLCNFVPFSMTYRPSFSMRTSFNCCSTDGCNSEQTELPAVPRTPNGFQCPSCLALGVSQCRNMDTLLCSGNEDHCFEITGTLMINNMNFTKASAGCATAGTCSKKVGVHQYTKDIVDILTQVKCYPAIPAGSTRTEL
ncbi:phospholipase A2 inhibitor and Ly6/PLAUR domain-containing protein-like [Eublepharis macularius]|uniref:Phospholipase A2 inhibitor and Ly6/PLAUR domain-containing protein-like n=1 Tax=Eublepharis macularius TaxID=481883 RepID=A0AA97KDH6_EUBMA|nr:phospholipase A2 inhibitor and Ly6/PLAUR domain-containing protein-like [Eublepharis macularius]